MVERRYRKKLTTLLLTLLVLLLIPSGISAEVNPYTRIDQERWKVGLPALVPNETLRAYAQKHADEMAAKDSMHHSDISRVPEYRLVGENVGRGTDLNAIHKKLMDSPPHRANIREHKFTEIGIGQTYRNGRWYIVQVFRLPSYDSTPESLRRVGQLYGNVINNEDVLAGLRRVGHDGGSVANDSDVKLLLRY